MTFWRRSRPPDQRATIHTDEYVRRIFGFPIPRSVSLLWPKFPCFTEQGIDLSAPSPRASTLFANQIAFGVAGISSVEQKELDGTAGTIGLTYRRPDHQSSRADVHRYCCEMFVGWDLSRNSGVRSGPDPKAIPLAQRRTAAERRTWPPAAAWLAERSCRRGAAQFRPRLRDPSHCR